MINYLKVKKVRRARILEDVLAELPQEQGLTIQDMAAGLMEADPKGRIDYTHALEIIMELGVNAERA